MGKGKTVCTESKTPRLTSHTIYHYLSSMYTIQGAQSQRVCRVVKRNHLRARRGTAKFGPGSNYVCSIQLLTRRKLSMAVVECDFQIRAATSRTGNSFLHQVMQSCSTNGELCLVRQQPFAIQSVITGNRKYFHRVVVTVNAF